MHQSHEFWESNQDGVGCYKSDAKQVELFAPWAEGILACSQGSTSKVHKMSKKNRKKKNSIWLLLLLLLLFFFIVVLVWSLKHQVQTMGRRCQRVNFIDRKLLRMWAVPRRVPVIFWSSSMLTVLGILSTHFSSLFLMTPSAPMTTGIVCFCFPYSGNFNFQVFTFRDFIDYLNVCFSVRWDCDIYNLHFWFVWSLIMIFGLLVAISLSV